VSTPVQPKIEVQWPVSADPELRVGVHRVLHDVVEIGGAVGYLSPPTEAETDAWLDGTLSGVRLGNSALAVTRVGHRVEAVGLWRRRPDVVFAHLADVEKIMAHPGSRGLGLGRLIVEALSDNARAAGIETLGLGVRGNNHGAIELYEQLGFREWGRHRNVVEVGDERYDDVRMSLVLGRDPNIVLRGSEPGGPGSSPRRSAAG
jgi:ribosomal protein S18 acetylase RimI-like enzyme